MKTSLERYPFIVRKLSEEEGGGFLCEFPDIAGVFGDGKTALAAIKDGQKALGSAVAALRETGRNVPPPGSASGQWRMRAPRSLHQRLAARAKAEGVSLNTLAVSLLAEGLGRRSGKAG
ncbi:MAG TPA: toxin-antitoxin system HicB family antitoxin [Rhizomicrobium sp.]|jgi:antitoxin HicB